MAPSTYYAAKRRQPVGAGGARRGDDADPDGAVGREPQGLRGAQALEGGPPGRSRHRPGPGRPADARDGHRGRVSRSAARCSPPAPIRRGAGPGPGEARLHRRSARRACGSRTSPTCRPGRGWRMCASSSTRSAAGSSAGGWRRTCAPTWSSTRSRWPAGPAAPGVWSVWWPTPMPARSSRRCGSPNVSTRSAPAPRSAPSPTATTTRWPRRSTGSTRPSASTGPTPRLGRRRRARARDPVVGALVQRAPAPQPLRRRAPRRVRSSVLRCPTDRPRRGRKPIARASIRPRAVQWRLCTRWRIAQPARKHGRGPGPCARGCE